MHICFIAFDIDDLSVDPFIFGISDIDILPEVVLKFLLLHLSRTILL